MLFKKARNFIFKLSIERLDKKIGQKLEKISQFTFMTLLMAHPVFNKYYIRCHLISQFINPREVISNEAAPAEFDINFHEG